MPLAKLVAEPNSASKQELLGIDMVHFIFQSLCEDADEVYFIHTEGRVAGQYLDNQYSSILQSDAGATANVPRTVRRGLSYFCLLVQTTLVAHLGSKWHISIAKPSDSNFYVE
eukprot:3938672-Amphidinium_carterae.1